MRKTSKQNAEQCASINLIQMFLRAYRKACWEASRNSQKNMLEKGYYTVSLVQVLNRTNEIINSFIYLPPVSIIHSFIYLFIHMTNNDYFPLCNKCRDELQWGPHPQEVHSLGVLLRLSGLRTRRWHCCGTGLILAREILQAVGMRGKKEAHSPNLLNVYKEVIQTNKKKM